MVPVWAIVFYYLRIIINYYIEETLMNIRQPQFSCKMEEPERKNWFPQLGQSPAFLGGRGFYSHEHRFPGHMLRAISPLPSKKRRAYVLGPKKLPTDEKMKKINGKSDKYKRSTNNSHKKYISVARRLLLKCLPETEANHFKSVFDSLKNSRTYYFIVLCHAKELLHEDKLKHFQDQFFMLMNNKKDVYRKEIERAENVNFVNFRVEEIADIQFALKAYGLFFEGMIQEAVESVYKKDKVVILKKNQCRQTILMIRTLEDTLKEKRITQKGEGSEVGGEVAVKVEDIWLENDLSSLMENEEYEEYEKEEGYSERLQRPELNYGKSSSQKNEDKLPQKASGIYPLLGMQNSYPLFSCFYQIIFPFEQKSQRQAPPLNVIYSKLQSQKTHSTSTASSSINPLKPNFNPTTCLGVFSDARNFQYKQSSSRID